MARSVVVVEVKGYKIEPGADLSGANLEEANLTRTKLNGAKTHSKAIWPEGFDPVAAGVIFED